MDARKKRNLIEKYRYELSNSTHSEELPPLERDDTAGVNVYISVSMGDNFFFGINDTERNEEKASFFYEHAADAGNAYAQYKAGLLNAVLGMEADDDIQMTYGIKYLCQSYKNKHPQSFSALNSFIQCNYFPFDSVDELVEFIDENS